MSDFLLQMLLVAGTESKQVATWQQSAYQYFQLTHNGEKYRFAFRRDDTRMVGGIYL